MEDNVDLCDEALWHSSLLYLMSWGTDWALLCSCLALYGGTISQVHRVVSESTFSCCHSCSKR